MAKVTSKLQFTIPKDVATMVGITPGDELVVEVAGDIVRLIPSARKMTPSLDAREELERRLREFDEAHRRQQARNRKVVHRRAREKGRGWTREELYDRGISG